MDTEGPWYHPAVPQTLLNLGCGLAAPEGWINIDRSPNLYLDRVRPLKRTLHRAGLLQDAHMAPWPDNIRRVDIRKRLPFETGSVDGVYSSHTLEHLYLDEAQRVLGECRRVLRTGGVLRLALPDASEFARELVTGLERGEDGAGREFNRMIGGHPTSRPTPKRRVMKLLASPPHRWQPTPDLVHDLLIEAGFGTVQPRNFQDGELPDLKSVEHRERSLFVEATP